MNILSVAGFFFILSVVAGGILTTITEKEYHLFGDLPAIFLVIGGTIGAASVTVQINRVGALLKSFFIRMIKGKRINYKSVVQEMMIITEGYRRGESINELLNKTSDYFLIEALQMVDDNVLKGEELFDVLENRMENLHIHYTEEASRFKNLGKYPPAFGLMGTVLGMVALLSNLGGADAMKLIGPAMGGCLMATFFGIVVANVFILPIGDSMGENAKEIYLKNRMILEGVRLVVGKTNPIIVAEKLNSYLLPNDRLNWKEVLGSEV
jgi:chemotaxis protein MotA